MKPRIIHHTARYRETTKDGLVKVLPVDQFSCKDFNRNKFGWPKSDLTLLLEYTTNNVDLDKFNAFASRIHMLKAEKPNNKTVEQLIHEWRPSWIQTVSEEQAFAKWYYEEFDKPLEKSDSDSVTESDPKLSENE